MRLTHTVKKCSPEIKNIWSENYIFFYIEAKYHIFIIILF